MMNRILQQNMSQIHLACQQMQVKNLYAFGSVLTPEFRENSDVDFIVEFSPMQPEDYADRYFDLCDALERMLNRKVDLITEASIRNPFFKKEVEQTRQIIYPFLKA